METLTLNTKEQFLEDLRTYGYIRMSMEQLQTKYSYIASKASIKRDIQSLVDDGVVEKNTIIKNHNNKITSTVTYTIK